MLSISSVIVYNCIHITAFFEIYTSLVHLKILNQTELRAFSFFPKMHFRQRFKAIKVFGRWLPVQATVWLIRPGWEYLTSPSNVCANSFFGVFRKPGVTLQFCPSHSTEKKKQASENQSHQESEREANDFSVFRRTSSSSSHFLPSSVDTFPSQSIQEHP